MTKLRTVSALVVLACAVIVSAPVLAKTQKLKIELREWNISTSEEFLDAGEVEIRVKNKGEEVHELVVFKLDTDLATGRLPVDRFGAIDEDSMTFGTLVDEIEDIEPGKKGKLTVRLKPGRYAIICNVLEEEPDGSMEAHYSMGMHAVLNVQ